MERILRHTVNKIFFRSCKFTFYKPRSERDAGVFVAATGFLFVVNYNVYKTIQKSVEIKVKRNFLTCKWILCVVSLFYISFSFSLSCARTHIHKCKSEMLETFKMLHATHQIAFIGCEVVFATQTYIHYITLHTYKQTINAHHLQQTHERARMLYSVCTLSKHEMTR